MFAGAEVVVVCVAMEVVLVVIDVVVLVVVEVVEDDEVAKYSPTAPTMIMTMMIPATTPLPIALRSVNFFENFARIQI